jgi:hypothetical protein
MPRATELSDQWLDYRWRVWWQLAVLAASFATIFIFISFGRNTVAWQAAGAIAATFLVPCLFIATMRLQFFPCPGCGQPFFTSRFGFASPPILVHQCMHCGLPKWQN